MKPQASAPVSHRRVPIQPAQLRLRRAVEQGEARRDRPAWRERAINAQDALKTAP